jgi:hypothetical protein
MPFHTHMLSGASGKSRRHVAAERRPDDAVVDGDVAGPR